MFACKRLSVCGRDWCERGDQTLVEFQVPLSKIVEEELTRSILGAFFEVYNALGFGFLEQIYLRSMERELLDRGHKVGREVAIHVMYKGEPVGTQRLDMVVDKKIVVEVKSSYQLHPAALRQVFSYLRGSGLEVGLLLHFGPKAKFYRQINKPQLGTDSTDLTDGTD